MHNWASKQTNLRVFILILNINIWAWYADVNLANPYFARNPWFDIVNVCWWKVNSDKFLLLLLNLSTIIELISQQTYISITCTILQEIALKNKYISNWFFHATLHRHPDKNTFSIFCPVFFSVLFFFSERPFFWQSRFNSSQFKSFTYLISRVYTWQRSIFSCLFSYLAQFHPQTFCVSGPQKVGQWRASCDQSWHWWLQYDPTPET